MIYLILYSLLIIAFGLSQSGWFDEHDTREAARKERSARYDALHLKWLKQHKNPRVTLKNLFDKDPEPDYSMFWKPLE